MKFINVLKAYNYVNHAFMRVNNIIHRFIYKSTYSQSFNICGSQTFYTQYSLTLKFFDLYKHIFIWICKNWKKAISKNKANKAFFYVSINHSYRCAMGLSYKNSERFNFFGDMIPNFTTHTHSQYMLQTYTPIVHNSTTILFFCCFVYIYKLFSSYVN